MERQVFFLQFLLVPVMTTKVIYSCGDCVTPRTMEESICAGEALIMATPISRKKVGGTGNYVSDLKLTLYFEYEMYMNTIYHKGPNHLQESHNFTVFSPKECPVNFLPEHEYYLAGVSDGDTSLIVTNCDYVEPVDWEKEHQDNHETKNDILTRQKLIHCRK